MMGRTALILVLVLSWLTVAIASCSDTVAAADRMSITPPERRIVTPIPEPGTWLLMLGGLVAVVWWVRRK